MHNFTSRINGLQFALDMSRAHKAVFGVGVAADRQAAGQWETEKGGEYYATGVGGSVTGRRCDLGIIDDPVKSREDADSELRRERAWEGGRFLPYVEWFSPKSFIYNRNRWRRY